MTINTSSTTTTKRLTPTTSGHHAIHHLLPRLSMLDEEEIRRPHADPHAAAVTALLVADWLNQPAMKSRLREVPLGEDAPTELAQMARAIVATVAILGGDYLSDVKAIPPEIEAAGRAVRQSTIKELEKVLCWDQEVMQWLAAIKMSEGIVDLVYDLRTLADLLTRHSHVVRESLARLPMILRTASDAIEYALRSEEASELAVARGSLARLWTIFVPAYERAALAGRMLTCEQGHERNFPRLAVIAAHRRARRRDVEPQERHNNNDDDDDDVAALTSATSKPAPRETGSRRAHRAILELEVGIESESNFYVGFSENLSTDGIFVATYLIRPLGAKMDIALTFPDGETMRVSGVVCWQRTASESGWPGVGVQFDPLTPEQEKRIARFIKLREPLFYAD